MKTQILYIVVGEVVAVPGTSQIMKGHSKELEHVDVPKYLVIGKDKVR